jgi:hypothetical protein
MSNRTLFGELPQWAGDTFLYCPRCGTRSSATRGDYWTADPNETIVCRGGNGDGRSHARHRVVCMFVARELCQIVKVKA